MTELRKPAEMTREAVGRLIFDELLARHITRTNDLVEKANFSQAFAKMFLSGRPFPQRVMTVETEVRTGYRAIRTHMAALAQICRFLDLDFKSCVEAAGFPTSGNWLKRAEDEVDIISVSADDLERAKHLLEGGPRPFKDFMRRFKEIQRENRNRLKN